MAEYNTRNCEICGKEIVITAGWAYKIKPPKGPTKYFCTYGCMRKYEADHQEVKKDLMAEAEEKPKPKKQPQDRGKTALAIVEEIRAGRNPIKFLKESGYGNPYEAYNAVRHFAETKGMKDVLKVMLPLKQLKYERKKPTGRPRKVQVTTVEKVPDIEKPEEAAEVLNLQGGVNYQVKVDEATKTPGFRYEIKTIETDIGDFSYDRKAHMLIFRRRDEEKEFGYQYLSMSTQEWDKLLIIVPQLADLMGVTL